MNDENCRKIAEEEFNGTIYAAFVREKKRDAAMEKFGDFLLQLKDHPNMENLKTAIKELEHAWGGKEILTFEQKHTLYEQVRKAEKTPLPADMDDADYARYPTMTQAASGRGNPKSAVQAYNESIEWAEEPTKMRLENIDEIRNAIYESILMALNASDVGKWHVLSKTQYGEKGWANIAKSELEQKKREGTIKTYSKSDVERLARNIQNQVTAHRENLSTEECQDD